MKQTLQKRIGVVCITFFLIFVFFIIGCYKDSIEDSISGKQWLKAQELYMLEFQSFANDVDTITTLYITDGISEEDFCNHIILFQAELNVMKAKYQQDKLKHPVRTASHTYDTKRGCEAVEECYQIFQDLLIMMNNNCKEQEKLSYKYLIYQQRFINSISEFMTAKELVEKD